MLHALFGSLVGMDSSSTVSRTALTSAAARAAHLLVDHEPLIFVDPLAQVLLGERGDELIAYHQRFGSHPVLAGARAEVLCRSLFTETLLTESALPQYVILGAGLDTYAYRSGAGRSVFEVDHPASQAWKRQAVETAGISAHGGPTFVPVDLERDPLVEALVEAGFDLARPSFVSLLGVSMYLSGSALEGVVAALASFAAGSQIVVDYMLTPELRDDAGRAYAEAVGAAVAEDGEPWLSFYTPDELTPIFVRHGFTSVRHVALADSIDLGLWRRTDAVARMGLSGLLHATRQS